MDWAQLGSSSASYPRTAAFSWEPGRERGWKVQDAHHPTRVSHLSVTKPGFLEGVVTGFQGGGFQGNKPQDTGPSNYLYHSD